MKNSKPKITNWSFTIDNNLQEGRSVMHDTNFMYSGGQTITLDIQYEDGTTKSVSEYHPCSSKLIFFKKR